jgi:AraC-like DNA-binding protein
MTETLFAFDKGNYRECQSAYRGEKNQEYYLGDYTIEAGSVIDVRAEKKAVGSCSIIHLRSKTRLSFRRTWAHIREDATDVTVLWFVKSGRMSIAHQCGHSEVEAGHFAITKSMTPFYIQCQPDEHLQHEVLHVIVPTHVFRRFVPHEVNAGFTITGRDREFALAERLLVEVFEDTGTLSEHTAQLLLDSALSVVADVVNNSANSRPVRQSLPDLRLQEALRYIDVHLSDPHLTITMVAEASDISPRYLSFLLKQNGTPFSELLWDKRMEIASRWLSSSAPGEISIAQVAFQVGFKSPAHFSRMFKRVFKKGPREFRAACQANALQIERNGFSASSNTLQ